MTTKPLDAVQAIGEMRSKVASLPLQTLLIPQQAARPTGPVAEALAGANGIVETVNRATESIIGSKLSLAEKEAQIKESEADDRIEELREEREERREDRRERRRGGGVAEMFQVMQTMLATASGGSSEQIMALRQELAAMQQARESERTQALIDAQMQRMDSLAGEIRDVNTRLLSGGDASTQEIEKVRGLYEQMRQVQELFGGHDTSMRDASSDVQSIMLRHKLRREEQEFEEDLADRRLERERTHARFVEEMQSMRRRDDQVDGLLENLMPALDALANKYVPGMSSSAPAADAPAAQPEWAPQPQASAPPRGPVQLPPEVALATCPACGGQAPIPVGYGDYHGVCVGCGAVVTVNPEDVPAAEASPAVTESMPRAPIPIGRGGGAF